MGGILSGDPATSKVLSAQGLQGRRTPGGRDYTRVMLGLSMGLQEAWIRGSPQDSCGAVVDCLPVWT